VVRKFAQKGLRKKTRKMVKFVAFARKWALKHSIFILDTFRILFFCFGVLLRFATLNLFFSVGALFQANRTLKSINFLLAIKALWVMLFRILPFFKLHCDLVQFVGQRFVLRFTIVGIKAFFMEWTIANTTAEYRAFGLLTNIAEFIVVLVRFLELLVFESLGRRLFLRFIFNPGILILWRTKSKIFFFFVFL
jgi:hypothetical protein